MLPVVRFSWRWLPSSSAPLTRVSIRASTSTMVSRKASLIIRSTARSPLRRQVDRDRLRNRIAEIVASRSLVLCPNREVFFRSGHLVAREREKLLARHFAAQTQESAPFPPQTPSSLT